MPQAAHVESVRAIESFRSSLIRFRERALSAIEAAGNRLAAASQRIDNRLRHWNHVAQRAEESYSAAERAYEACTWDEDNDCSGEADSLAEARRALESAQESLDACRGWQARFQEASQSLESQLRVFRDTIDETGSGALAFLQKALTDLDRYLSVSTASTTLASTARRATAPPEKSLSALGFDANGLLGLVTDRRREVLEQRLRTMSAGHRRELSELLSREGVDASVLAHALAASPGNQATNLHDEMAEALPGAMLEILNFQDEVGGLFSRMELRGDTKAALQSFGKGKAYEILATARRLRLKHGPLAIRRGHHIAFGPKSQARYAPQDDLVTGLQSDLRELDKGRKRGRWTSLKAKSKDGSFRKTVESDNHLAIPSEEGWPEIMEDYKYTDGGEYGGDLRTEIVGMGVALSTGEIHSARLICNKKLPQRVHDQVADMNSVLASRGVEGRIEIYEDFDWREAA